MNVSFFTGAFLVPVPFFIHVLRFFNTFYDGVSYRVRVMQMGYSEESLAAVFLLAL